MSIKQSMTNNKGFTIVELLIVVIVIAILATITLVSFNNVTSRANQSAADSAVATFSKKAELYLADGPTGKYPIAAADLSGAASSTTYQLPATSFAYAAASTLTADDKNKVTVVTCPASATAATITGLRVSAWKFSGTGSGAAAEAKVLGTCA